MLKGDAFRKLNGSAKNVLFDFYMRRVIEMHRTPRGKEPVIINNGEIEYCYSEAQTKGISRPAMVRSIDALIEYGFIDLVHQGEGGRKGDKNKYAISDRWRAWGTDRFIPAIRPKDTRKGVGFAAQWAKKKKTSVTKTLLQTGLSSNETVTPNYLSGNENVTPNPMTK